MLLVCTTYKGVCRSVSADANLTLPDSWIAGEVYKWRDHSEHELIDFAFRPPNIKSLLLRHMHMKGYKTPQVLDHFFMYRVRMDLGLMSEEDGLKVGNDVARAECTECARRRTAMDARRLAYEPLIQTDACKQVWC